MFHPTQQYSFFYPNYHTFPAGQYFFILLKTTIFCIVLAQEDPVEDEVVAEEDATDDSKV